MAGWGLPDTDAVDGFADFIVWLDELGFLR